MQRGSRARSATLPKKGKKGDRPKQYDVQAAARAKPAVALALEPAKPQLSSTSNTLSSFTSPRQSKVEGRKTGKLKMPDAFRV